MKIGGYVNVKDKNSKLMKDENGNKFIETVADGVFQKALLKAKFEGRQIPLLWRHKEILSNDVELNEDQIGLRFEATVEEDVYKMCKDEDMRCSFGFEAIKDSITNITDSFYKRVLEDINLLEITLTDRPAYEASIAECREENECRMELREIAATLKVLNEEVQKIIEERETENDGEKEKEKDGKKKNAKDDGEKDNAKAEDSNNKDEANKSKDKEKKEEKREIKFDTDFYTKRLNALK